MAAYIISYDIADAKRLGKVARYLERQAIRIQHSIFYVEPTNSNKLYDIIEMLNSYINEQDDDIRIYTVINTGAALGQAVDLNAPLTFT